MDNPIILDFETKGIMPRPQYPPAACGFSIQFPGERVGKYYAWGHKGGGNNTTKEQAANVLREAWRSSDPILFHHGKFDIEVAANDFGLPMLPWHRYHDTLFLTFLWNPRLYSMKLKDVAEQLLDIAPDERDELRDWIIAHVPEAKKKPSTWGAYIWLAPAALAGRYANADTKMTKRLFRHLYPLIVQEGMLEAYNRERQLMPVLMRMEQAGVPVDHAGLKRDVPKWMSKEQEYSAEIFRKLKVPKRDWGDWRSGKDTNYPGGYVFGGNKLADQLEAAGKVEAFVLTDKGNRSTSAENLSEVCKDKRLKELLEVHSQITNCITTFGIPWLRVAGESKGKIYTNFNQVRAPEGGAATGRLSCYPNLQNIIRSDKGVDVPQLRNYIIPGPGHLLVARDYSQQELRILAHFEEGDLAEQYASNPALDAHTTIQQMVLDVTGYEMQRPETKTLNFMQVYGGGANGVAYKLKIDYQQAQLLRKYHQQALPGVQQLQKSIKQLVKAGEPIVTWGGRVYYVEEPKMMKGRMRTFEYKLLNVLIQGSAADCTKQAMINYSELVGKKWDDYPLLLQIHDELLGKAKGGPAESKKMHKWMAEAMADVNFDIPMLSDGKTSRKSWGQMEKV